MALEVPRAFLSDDRPVRRHVTAEEPERLYRLPPVHTQALGYVARGVEESDVGVCCSYLVDSMSGEGADYDEHALNTLERFTEQAVSFDDLAHVPVVSAWRARIQRCRRALAALRHHGEHRAVDVLMVVYGYPDPIVRHIPELNLLGQYASLARYTEVVETKRQEMCRNEAALLTNRPGIVDLGRYRQMLEWADRATSSSDALRAALLPFGEPHVVPTAGESHHATEARRESRRARETAHKDRRAGFITQLRIEASRMLSRAEARYHGAWLTVAR